ncbi:hypothetical protein FUAX_53910 (plasmid) [Fulvitalea axinellae]|uniref:Uncharacterized protein n=1 Tax=Fulvitalea axinellae TaxID=1182444 RepID=A0AAU9CLV4_9BACT|nr:hypothetical protein FUAX_53910 [Fulvitalea axinellae]
MISYVNSKSGKLCTEAYVFFQDLPSVRSSKGRARLRLKNMQVTTTEVSQWTSLNFDAKQIDSNPLKFYDGPESIRAKDYRDLMNKNPDTVALDEGIVGLRSVSEARNRLPLEEFYDLIDEVRWV